VTVARLTPSGRLAITAGRDGRVLIWNVAKASVVRAYALGGSINDVEASRSGRFVVAGSTDGTAAILGVTAESKRLLEGHSDDVVAVAFSRNGRAVATASADRTARLWNVQTGGSRLLEGHSGALTAVAFSRNGAFLATASTDTEVRVWNGKSGAQLAALRIHSGAVSDLSFSADGRWLASAGPLAAGIWETRTHGPWPALPLYLVRGAAPPRLDHVAFSPHGWRLLTGWRSGAVRVYDCRLCGGIKELRAIAKQRLSEIVRPRRPT
jgi:WD40 repeat protein